MKKFILILLSSTLIMSLSACTSSTLNETKSYRNTDKECTEEMMDKKFNPNNINPADYLETDEYLEAWINGVEENTSDMVDIIAHAAKANAKYSASNDKKEEAISYIASNYPEYFTDNSVMEKTMYYGYYLDYACADDESTYNYASIGTDAYQVVKYVYRNAEQKDDQPVLENLKQIKEGLEKIGYSVQ